MGCMVRGASGQEASSSDQVRVWFASVDGISRAQSLLGGWSGPVVRFYGVFNLEQTEGVTDPLLGVADIADPIAKADKVSSVYSGLARACA